MLNVGAMTPSAPATSGPPVASVGKDGDGGVADQQFGEMLDSLAQGAVEAPANLARFKAVASKQVPEAVTGATPVATDLLSLAGQVITDLDAVPGGQVGTDLPAKAVARRANDAPVDLAPAGGTAAAETNALLPAMLGAMTLPAIVQGSQPIASQGTATAEPTDSTAVPASPDKATPHGDAPVGQVAVAGARVALPSSERQRLPALPAMPTAGSPAATPPGVAGDLITYGAVGHPTSDAAADSTAPGGTIGKDISAEGAAALAAIQAGGPEASARGRDARSERVGDRRQSQPKSSAVTAATVGEAPDLAATQSPSLSAVGAGTPDGRQHSGDHPAGARPSPPPVSPVASSFETQVRVTTEMPSLSHATGGRIWEVTAAAAAAESAVLDSALPHQIVQAMRVQWNQGVGTARVTLQPDYLGELHIDIRVDHGAVTAVLDASNAAVRQWIEGHEPLLRQALADQGLTLDRLVVRDEPPQPSMSGDDRQDQEQEQPRRRRPREAPADATFEVVM